MDVNTYLVVYRIDYHIGTMSEDDSEIGDVEHDLDAGNYSMV